MTHRSAESRGGLISFKEAATRDAPMAERVRYWESYNACELVGLRCSSYADAGLDARQRNFDLDGLRIAEIVGNEHVIERTEPLVRRRPKHALFACLLLDGEGFFYQAGRCTLVHRGDLIVYGTDRPYLYGFARPMRQLTMDVGSDEFDDLLPGHRLPAAAVRIDAGSRIGGMLIQPLREQLVDFVETPLASLANSVKDDVLARLKLLIDPSTHGTGEVPGQQALRLLRAERFIAEHLGDPELDASAVAKHLAVSLRHMNRLFEQHNCSVRQWIWGERLRLAESQLRDPTQRHRTIGDIALACGFSTQSHFAREFKLRYERTPTEHRSASASAGPPAQP